MKKYFSLLWILILSFSSIAAQSNQSMTNLQELISAIVRICPINCGQGLSLNSIKLSTPTKLVTMTISVNSEFFSLDNINSQKEQIATNIINNWATNESLSLFVSNMADSGVSVKVIYNDKKVNKSTEVIISNSKIKNTLASEISASENSERLLQTYIETERRSVGKEITTGMVMTAVEDMGSYIVFRYLLDETYYDIDVLASNVNQSVYEVIRELINDPIGKHEMGCFSENGRGVKYIYVGKTSKRQAEGSINFEDLYDLTH